MTIKSILLALASVTVFSASAEIIDCTSPKAETTENWLGNLADALKKTNTKLPSQLNQISAEWKKELQKGATSNYKKITNKYYCTAVAVEDGPLYFSFAQIKPNEQVEITNRPSLGNRIKITAWASHGTDGYKRDVTICFIVKAVDEAGNQLNEGYVKVDKRVGFPSVADSCD
jgi:hypothetical protein